MMIREPVMAGQFYPANQEACLSELKQLFAAEPLRLEDGSSPVAGLVPHAGWVCSGEVSAQVLSVLAAHRKPEVVVLFGGVHNYRGKPAAMFAHGRWDTPLGHVDVQSRLAERILGHTSLIVEDPFAHENEHSIEVQLPMIRYVFPNARILPIMVPVVPRAHEIGEAVARTIKTYDYNAVIVGTTDLTHYGPRYGFVPRGVGAEANAWAKVENDARFVTLLCSLRIDELVPEATAHMNACNSGAAAATAAAAKAMGATRGVLLEHTSSREVLMRKFNEPQEDSVGYAGVVFV
jgi:hypothetical protein